jgi:histidinol-phosphate aminotransferase
MAGNLADAVGFVREDVQKMKAYAPGEQLKGCIKLNTNECAWGPAPAVLKAVCSVTEDQLRLYPSPLCDKVRQAASEVFGVQPAQVLVGNGSDDCLTIIMRTFSQPGDSVACAWPTYSLYDTLASIQGVGIQHVDWSAQPDPALGEADGVPGWHLPITGLLQTAARVVFIANPNNPSATRVPLPALEYLATHLKGILVVDEAYIDYALDGDGMAASFLGKLDAYPNVIILRTFSKSYSMAGARLGLMFAHVELINHMNKVKDSYNVNALTQLAGEAALLDRDYFRWLVGETIKQRKALEAACKGFGWTWPTSDANFLLVEVGSAAKAGALYERCRDGGVLVRYWGSRPELSTKLRVTVGTKESVDKFVSIVTQALPSLEGM